MDHRTRRSRRDVLGVIVASILVVAACSGAASPSAGGASTAPAASTGGATTSTAPASAAAAGTKHVSILNKDMTDDEIKAEIQKEAGVVVGNWTYSANSTLIDEFQKYVKATYGVDITLTYDGSQAPSEYLTKLAAATQHFMEFEVR